MRSLPSSAYFIWLQDSVTRQAIERSLLDQAIDRELERRRKESMERVERYCLRRG